MSGELHLLDLRGTIYFYPGKVAHYTGIVFEPRAEFKGDLARTYFYMATRYQSRIAAWETLDPYGNVIMNGTSYPCFESWFIDMLIAWHNADPVSQKEIDRNNDIYTIQNNRNPFIDHPEYVAAIWTPTTQVLPEPSSYPLNFSAHNIKLQWNEATGTILPDGYLVRMSAVSFDNIQTPIDAIPIPDGQTDKYTLYGVHEVWFTNLNPNTTYYFKLYSYSGFGAAINYKTDGTIPQALKRTTQ